MKYIDSVNLTIAYDGAALEDGTMDVQELAPALLAIGELINECNKVINGKEEKIQIRIKADFKKGSFQTEIIIAKGMIDQLMLTLGPAFKVKDLLELIGFFGGTGAATFLGLIKLIKGRKISKAKQYSDDKVEIIFEDGSSPVITNFNVYNIYNNLPVHESVEKIMKPLKREGIDSFYTSSNGQKLINIDKKEAEYFKIPTLDNSEKEELILEAYSTGIYKVITASFEEGYKWRLSNGQDKINASISDKNFMELIESNKISISKEDLFKVKIKTKQWKKTDNSLRTENEIVEVIEHIKAEKANQLFIPFE